MSILPRRLKTGSILNTILLLTGFSLIAINIYGLFMDIRKEDLHSLPIEQTRFVNPEALSYSESLQAINSIQGSDNFDVAQKANIIVNTSLTHIRWNKVAASEFNQLIPVWENYFLYFIGKYSGLPQFERYHYVNYKRSIERGIGICGDASMVLSQILDKENIDNQIISFPGHVITSVKNQHNQSKLYDPDFGVVIEATLVELSQKPQIAENAYKQAGYSDREIGNLISVYNKPYTEFDNTYAFMAKRYIFEYTSYTLKWLLPLGLVIFVLISSRQKRGT